MYQSTKKKEMNGRYDLKYKYLRANLNSQSFPTLQGLNRQAHSNLHSPAQAFEMLTVIGKKRKENRN